MDRHKYRPLKWWTLTLLLGAMTAGFFASRPVAEMIALRNATKAKDAVRLQELIDFPSLRESVRNKFMGVMAAITHSLR